MRCGPGAEFGRFPVLYRADGRRTERDLARYRGAAAYAHSTCGCYDCRPDFAIGQCLCQAEPEYGESLFEEHIAARWHEPEFPFSRGKQYAAQQHDAVPCLELDHRPAG